MDAEVTPTAAAAPADTEMDMLGLESEDETPANGEVALPEDAFADDATGNGHGGGNGTGAGADTPVPGSDQGYTSNSQPASPQPTSFPTTSVFFNAAKQRQDLL